MKGAEKQRKSENKDIREKQRENQTGNFAIEKY